MRAMPGEMSKEDAERLLDSLKSEESKYPFTVPPQRDEAPIKDW